MTELATERTVDPHLKVRYLQRLLAANDVTQALQVAVDQIVDVLGSDVSWTGLIDDGYLVMGAHRGLVSTEMASAWRLKVGEGIGGRVAAEGRPHVSRDYLHDRRRVPLMKRLIDNEGILATLTVPLLIADTTIGVLYAAQRNVYDWKEWEEHAATDIAHDLAVRLRQLDVEGRTAAHAARAEDERDRMRRFAADCVRLATSFSQQSDAGAALDLLALELGARVELRLPDGTLVRAAGEYGEGNPFTAWRATLTEPEGVVLSVIATRRPDEASQTMIELATALFRLQLARSTERERTLQRVGGELFDQLFSGRVADAAEFRQRLALMGVVLPPEAYVVVVGDRTGAPLADVRLAQVSGALQQAFEACVPSHRHGRVVAVVGHRSRSATDLRRTLTDLVTRVPALRGAAAGVGRQCAEVADFSMSFDEARAAFEIVTSNPAADPVTSAFELGILGVASLPPSHLRTTVRDLLGPIISSDETRGTDYVLTLRAYLQNDRHLGPTSAELHVHYNTVRNRIARIEDLLGVDTRNVDDRFRLHTALRMHELLSATGPAQGHPDPR
ncbi:GAF domain-containing protein [Nocardioides terrae]|uniref:GAF domain-containing protein n=1 Tax=Nocardioides terrae TaxID=574651 RepID=A0A1I1F2I0_9ACTN|nr:helix-turn-helix domain-containing protein [Nocardioides terrae]SFB93491.1 GAF domain-containing protein [Nocardioides terrae]